MLRKLFAITLLAGAVSIFGLSGLALASSKQDVSNINVPKEEVVNRTLYSAGSTVDIAGTVNGDVFCVAQTLTITGHINGDIICAAQTININGPVSGNVRIAGQAVSINSSVSGSTTVIGQSFSFGSQATVGMDLTVLAASANIDGAVSRDVALNGADIFVSGTIGRNITGNINKLNINKGANVNGGIYVTSPADVAVASDATVKGEIVRTPPKTTANASQTAPYPIAMAIYFFISMLLVSIVLALIMPKIFSRSTELAKQSTLKTALIGLAIVFVVPIVLLSIFITIIGIPLSILLGIIWFVAVLLSGPFFAYFIGHLLLKTQKNPVLIMLAGSVIILLLYMIPIINVFTMIVAYIYGIGIIFNYLSTKKSVFFR